MYNMKINFLVSIWMLFCTFGHLAAQHLTQSQEQEWRAQIRSTLFVPDQLPTLNAEVHSKFEPMPGVIAERITYNTLLGLKVSAILYLPDPRPAGKIPALIVVNGHGGDKYAWYAFYSGMLYAKAGAAVLTYDPIGEGERNINRESGTRAHDVRQEPRELGLRMGGLMMTDVMQAVSFLSQRPEVDNDRIAAMGYSMGSFVLGLAGAVETRLHATVLVGGGNLDGPGGIWDKSKPMCQGIPYQSMSFLGDRPAALYALQASRGPVLIYAGLQDSTVSFPRIGTWSFFDDLYQRTAKLRGSSKGVFDYNFTDGGHRPNFVTKPVAIWLEKQLDFPNWTEAGIQAMPVTHISEWAKTFGAELDPTYSSEIREGGTLALSSGIPVLSRNDLSVFTKEQWDRKKNQLIYESWLVAAREQLKHKELISLYTGNPIKVDAQLDESEWAVAKSITLRDDSEELYVKDKVTHQSDNKVLIRTLWDENNLYFSFKVEDKYLQAKQNVQDHPQLFMDDMVEILIDANNDKGSCWNADDVIYHINLLGIKKDDRGTVECRSNSKWNGNAKISLQLEGTLNDSTDIDQGYIVEVSISWKELNVKPVSGLIIGVNFANGDSGRLFDWVGASPFRSPYAFGNMILTKAKE